jgi:hypothetical protein
LKVPDAPPRRKARHPSDLPPIIPPLPPRASRRKTFHKNRRHILGGRRGDGNKRKAPIRRPDPSAIRIGAPDPSLSSFGGLVGFGAFLRSLGVDQALSAAFDCLKPGLCVIYPMSAQMRLLIDLFAVGEFRILGLEAVARDPLFVHLAGGVLPSLDTVYRDAARFLQPTLEELDMSGYLDRWAFRVAGMSGGRPRRQL